MNANAPLPLVLVLCTGNSCRSHLAEGILVAASQGRFRVASAGSKPAGFVHPLAAQVMKEIGVDISAHHSKHLNEFLNQPVETVITVCGNVTVRRISYGEGVERVFPVHSPRIAKIEVETAGTARRAKLNYLRDRKGKQAMAVREKAQATA